MPPRLGATHTQSHGDVLCFSHLRWNWVFQRPQHLLTRAARDRRTFYVEEAVFGPHAPELRATSVSDNLKVVTPHIPSGSSEAEATSMQRSLLDALLHAERIEPAILWYYTPMALPHTAHLTGELRVYDCMDELSAFAGAPPSLQALEAQLLACSDVVFTGGWSLHAAKAALHPNCHAMPSSVDLQHFRSARTSLCDPLDHVHVPRPRIGYCGVLDERLDLQLIAGVADARPEWHLVFVGPVTKIDPASLPRRANVHYLGLRSYDALPGYMAAWNVAWMPFALNDSTRFISPTKTPEYLAAGCPVVSTPVRDVVTSWGTDGLVRIADGVADCVVAIAACLEDRDATRLKRVDRALRRNSWDATWERMRDIMQRARARPRAGALAS